MVPQSKGKIFLADERGLNELDWFRSYNTFNFGKYRNEHKTPFGGLYLLNDDTLAGEKSLKLTVEEDSDVLIFPVVGSVVYNDNMGHADAIVAGQCQVYAAPRGTTIEVGNPYKNELVNFIQVWVKRTGAVVATEPQLFSFDVNSNKNQLLPVSCGQYNKSYIGKYTGREEGVHKVSAGHGLFAFVIEGAFEVQYRLLHARDGLALWDVQEVEWEALSNDAILFITEVPMYSL